jgi:hypothetical protein
MNARLSRIGRFGAIFLVVMAAGMALWPLSRALAYSNLQWQLNDVNSNLQNINSQLSGIRLQRSLSTIRRSLDLQSLFVQRLRSYGMEAFYASGDGTCPANSYSFGGGACVCNTGYAYDMMKKISTNSSTPCFLKSSSATTSGASCKANSHISADGTLCLCDTGYIPNTGKTSCVPEQSTTCPLHSTRSADGSTCDCDKYYQPDPTRKYCVRIRSTKK